MWATQLGIGASGPAARSFLALLGVAAVLLVPAGSAAAGEVDRAAGTLPSPPPPLRLVVSGDMPRILETGVLRARLEAELHAAILLDTELGSAPDSGVVRIAYDAAGASLSVAYAAVEGSLVTRTITAPDRSGEVADLAVLLAGNLARDQAAELLAETRPAPTVAAESAWEPPPAPVPTEDTTLLRRWSRAATPVLRSLETEAWTSNLSLINMGARLSGRHLYALVNLSGHLESGHPLAGSGLALGAAHACLRLECGVDVGTTYLYGGNGPDGYTLNRLVSRARVHVAIAVPPGLTLFAGGGYALTTHLHHVPDNVSQLELFAGVRL